METHNWTYRMYRTEDSSAVRATVTLRERKEAHTTQDIPLCLFFLCTRTYLLDHGEAHICVPGEKREEAIFRPQRVLVVLSAVVPPMHPPLTVGVSRCHRAKMNHRRSWGVTFCTSLTRAPVRGIRIQFLNLFVEHAGNSSKFPDWHSYTKQRLWRQRKMLTKLCHNKTICDGQKKKSLLSQKWINFFH